MIFEKNYFDSNWRADISGIFLICLLFFFPSDNRESVLLLRITAMLVLLFIAFKFWYSLRKINRLKSIIANTPLENPIQIDRNQFYDLGISIFSDSIAIDILYENEIIHSIKRTELDCSSEDSCIVIVHSTWRNWNWRHIHFDKYYQVILELGNKSKNLVRIKKGIFTIASESINPQTLTDIAHKLASNMRIKIKDCTQHS